VDGDTLDVHFSNLSNVHTVVHDLQLVSGSGAPLGEPLDVHAAVLAGQERHWTLPLPKGDAADLTVDVRADQGHQRLSIPR
jgi:hypothetical protein